MAHPVQGTQLGGYTLVRLMARGGMGEVYEATENKLQRRVALKIIAPPNPDEHDADELVKRFLLEARMLAQLNHPNIVTIYSIDSVGGVPFIAMEYIEGVSFRELLEEFVFSTDGALPLFLQMLEGLRCLHDHKIVHRDLKPHNILLRPDGGVKILDFGIAKHQGGGHTQLTRVGIVVGTLPYMPPEVKSGVPASPRSDIWSLGAIFYECLTGERLVAALADNPDSHDVPFTAEQERKIPRDVRQLISRMCAARPADRHANVAEVIEELQRIQRNRPPVTSQIWTNLSKKVEEVATAKRRESSMSGLSPRVRELVEISNSQHAPPVNTGAQRESSVPIRDITDGRQRTQTKGHRRPSWMPASVSPTWVIGAFVVIGAATLIALNQRPTLEAPPSFPTGPINNGTPAGKSAQDAVILQEPSEGQILWLEPNRTPTVSWSRLLSVGEYDVQISTDSTFKKVLIQEPVQGGNFRPTHVLAEGTYFWRLWPHNGKSTPVGPRQFVIAHLSPVNLVQPDGQHSFDLRGTKSLAIDLTWACKPGVKHYRLQIAQDDKFTSPDQDLILTDCQARNVYLGGGQYLWRVRMEDVPQAESLWSETRAFKVYSSTGAPVNAAVHRHAKDTQAEESELGEPKLVDPKIALTLGFQKKPRDLASLPKVIEAAPELKWTAVKGAKSYLIQFATTRDFSRLLTEEHSAATRFEWRNVVPGRIYWRVAAVDANGEPGNFSGHGRIDIQLPPPEINGTYTFTAPEDSEDHKPITVEWPAAPLAEKYLVQFGNRRDLASSGAAERVTTGPKLSVDPVPGKYFMRVAIADSNGQAISSFSSVSPIEITSAAVMDGPQLLSPPSGAHAVARSGRISILFSWSKVPTAENYTLEVASDPEFKQVLDRRTTKDRGSLMKQAELKGKVYWRVRAKSPQGQSSWSKPGTFEVK